MTPCKAFSRPFCIIVVIPLSFATTIISSLLARFRINSFTPPSPPQQPDFQQPPEPTPSFPPAETFQPVNTENKDITIEKISLGINKFLSNTFPGLAPLTKALAKSWNSF